MPKMYNATLVRGKTYYLKNQEFKRNEPQKVDEATKLYLAEHAFDMVSVEGKPEPRYKFKFDEIAPAEPARQRRRRPDLTDEETEAAATDTAQV